jgi:hypothetical protein
MSCDVFLFRKEYVSFDQETCTDLIKQQKFWHVCSWELGVLFGEYYQICDEWKCVDPDDFLGFCRGLISEGKDDFGEYPNGALEAVVEDMEELGDDIRYGSDWFVTMHF